MKIGGGILLKRIVSIVLTIGFFVLLQLSGAAIMSTEYEVVPVSEDEQQQLFARNTVSVKNSEAYPDTSVESFAVNKEGEVLITIQNHLNLYDENSEFVASYEINAKSQGAIQGVFDLLDGNIIFFNVRDNCFIKMDRQGNLLEAATGDAGDNTAIMAANREATVKTVNGVRYEEKTSPIPFLPTSKIIKTDPDGTVTVLYDQSKEYPWWRLALGFGCMLLLVIAGIVFYKKYKKYMEENS